MSITNVFTGYADEATAKTDLAEFVVGSTWRADKVIINVTVTGETGFCLTVTTPDVRDDLFQKTNALLQIDEESGCVVRTKIDTLDLATTVLTKRTQNSKAHVHSATGLTWHRPQMPLSYWHIDVSAETRLHPNSANLVQEFVDQVTESAVGNDSIGVNSTSFSSPCWTAKLTTTPVTLEAIASGGFPAHPEAEFTAIRSDVALVPEATYAGGTDREFSVYDPRTGEFWEFWKGNPTGYPPITGVVYGGKTDDAATFDGIFGTYGVAASGLTMVQGQPHPDEVLYTGINHAIGISIIDGEGVRVKCWPSTRTDGQQNGFNTANLLIQGQRFRLKSSYNVAASSLHPYAKAIALAAQTYGFIIWDRAGDVTVRNSNEMPRTNLGLDNLWSEEVYDGTASFNLMDNFPWDQCEFLPMGYGNPDWEPTEFPGLVARYKMYHTDFVSVSGSAVAGVYEQSGCAHHVSSPNTDPTYGSTTWSGTKGGITFANASNNYLTSTGVMGFRMLSTADKCAVFGTVRITADTSCRIWSYIADGGTADDDNDASFSFQWVAGTGFRIKRNGVSVDIAASINTNYVVGFVFDGTNVTTYLKSNGNALVTGTPTASSGNFGATGEFTLGGYTAASAGMTGRMSEVVVLSDAPSSQNITDYITYVVAEFGV